MQNVKQAKRAKKISRQQRPIPLKKAKSDRKVRRVNVEAAKPVPASFTKGYRNKRPKFKTTSNGTVVSHTEYLMDVPGTVNFSLPASQVVVVQPGLVDSFPWLAQIAASYEMYKVHSLQFQYRNRAGTGTQGSVYCAFQNDSEDLIFGSKQEMLAYEGSQDDVCYVPQNFDVVITDYMKKYFIRSNVLAAGSDSQLYDVGMFSISCNTNVAVPIAGELLVKYTVEFFKPKISQSLGSGYYSNWFATGTTLVTMQQHPLTTELGDLTSELPYPAYFNVTPNAASDIVTIPMPGVYLFCIDLNTLSPGGTVTTPVTLSQSFGANLTLIAQRSTTDFLVPQAAPASLFSSWSIFRANAGGQDLANQFNVSFGGGNGATNWQGEYIIVQMNPNSIGPVESLSKHPRVRRRAPKLPAIEPKKDEQEDLELIDDRELIPVKLERKERKSSRK